MSASYRFVVSGQVQGVGFRAAAQRKALLLGVRGWIRNREDGAVEGAATGTSGDLAKFRVWLAQGAPASKVSGVEWKPSGSPVSEGSFWVRS